MHGHCINGTEINTLNTDYLCMVVIKSHSSKMLVCPTHRLIHTIQQWVLIKHLPVAFHVVHAKVLWLTACLNRNLLEASSGQHHSHRSSAPTRLLTLALGSNLSLAVRDWLSLDLCLLSNYTLCSSFLRWFVLLWRCSNYMNMLLTGTVLNYHEWLQRVYTLMICWFGVS